MPEGKTGGQESSGKNSFFLAIIAAYTAATVALMVSTVLMKWELWMVPVFGISLVIAWWLQITRSLSDAHKSGILLFFMMLEFFFYGVHKRSLFDMSSLAIVCMMLFSMVGNEVLILLIPLIYLCILGLHMYVYTIDFGSIDSTYVIQIMVHMSAVAIAYKITTSVIRLFRSERKRNREIIEELMENNRRTEDFMTNVSHEFRTPINVVMGITSIMLKEEADEELIRKTLSIRNAGERLYIRISDILDYTDIDTNRLSLSGEEYMVNSIVVDMIGYMKSYLTSAREKLELILDIDAEIPMSLYGDSRKIKTIIRHVLDNAIKFTREGGIYVKLSSSKKNYGVNLIIDVRDTGPGIPENERRKLTRGIYQLDSGKTSRSGGIGLGLPIVHGFTKGMGGFMRIDGIEEGGTRVSVSIPQKVVDPSPFVSLEKPDELCVIFCANSEKHTSPQMREYHEKLVRHLERGLGITIHRARNHWQFKNLLSAYRVTHVFIEQQEYQEAPEYYDSLSRDVRIMVIADSEDFRPDSGSRVYKTVKPFTCTMMANFLNAGDNADGTIFSEKNKLMFSGVRALVVDDEEMNLYVARGIFQNYGMKVWTASRGKEAIYMCSKEDFDIIFMDYMMPEMDGVEAMKVIRKSMEARKSQPIMIAFTANAVSGAREMFLEEGFDGFLAKPIETYEIEQLLRRLMPSRYDYQESVKEIFSIENPENPARAETAEISWTEGRAGADRSDRAAQTKEGAEAQEKAAGAGDAAADALAAAPAESEAKMKPDAGEGSDGRMEEKTAYGEAAGSGAQNPEKSRESWMESLAECGVDVSEGLNYCMNDVEIYKEILQQYVAESQGKIASLNKEYEAGNWKDYRIVVHALKSNSKMIGMNELFELARDMEDAARNENVEKLSAGHGYLIERYRQTVEKIELA